MGGRPHDVRTDSSDPLSYEANEEKTQSRAAEHLSPNRRVGGCPAAHDALWSAVARRLWDAGVLVEPLLDEEAPFFGSVAGQRQTRAKLGDGVCRRGRRCGDRLRQLRATSTPPTARRGVAAHHRDFSARTSAVGDQRDHGGARGGDAAAGAGRGVGDGQDLEVCASAAGLRR